MKHRDGQQHAPYRPPRRDETEEEQGKRLLAERRERRAERVRWWGEVLTEVAKGVGEVLLWTAVVIGVVVMAVAGLAVELSKTKRSR